MENMVHPFAVVFCAFLLSDFHGYFVYGANKSKGPDNEHQQLIFNILVSQNRRFEILESRNRELLEMVERQTKQMSHMASNILELQETVEKQRHQLDSVYKILNDNKNDNRTETYINDNTDQKSKNN